MLWSLQDNAALSHRHLKWEILQAKVGEFICLSSTKQPHGSKQLVVFCTGSQALFSAPLTAESTRRAEPAWPPTHKHAHRTKAQIWGMHRIKPTNFSSISQFPSAFYPVRHIKQGHFFPPLIFMRHCSIYVVFLTSKNKPANVRCLRYLVIFTSLKRFFPDNSSYETQTAWKLPVLL